MRVAIGHEDRHKDIDAYEDTQGQLHFREAVVLARDGVDAAQLRRAIDDEALLNKGLLGREPNERVVERAV